MNSSTIQITVREWNCEIIRDKKTEWLIPLIGGLELTKDNLIKAMRHWPDTVFGKYQLHTQYRRVNKNDAINHYLELGKKLQQRIMAIQNSDDMATFLIDPVLLHTFDKCLTE